MQRFISESTAEQVAAAIELPDSLIDAFSRATYATVGPSADAFAAFAKSYLPEVDSWVAAFEARRHPFAGKLPFLNFWYVAFSILCYFACVVVLLVISKILGKGKYRLLLLAHNLFLYALSLYMSVAIFVSARAANYSLWNNAAGESHAEWRLAKLLWLFYMSKVPEWVDTFVMCLKRNTHQITFLHLYHHSSVFLLWYVTCALAPGGEAYWSALVNSSVHVIMYGYYFLTTLFEEGKIRRFLNRFRFFITKGQMVQFGVNCIQSVYDLYIVPREKLNYDAGLLQVLFVYMLTLLVLFGNFLLTAPKRDNAPVHLKPARSRGEPSKTKNGSSAKASKKHPGPAYQLKEQPVFVDSRKSQGRAGRGGKNKKN
ncbi:elongation of very long chain fatty acids protein 4 [Trypanosoma grayi]|uniref:elongation of very long chain fatty acids protein 4 n=1 Tax=Trypanosoma grayi TaxID=71804 RepID=UPI0004F3FDC5|nr:elongation of very long chain fatty acids protein 4 [Trypanosoma grayi]KEG13110.1 elongation of very long chain fatty acids protein 4 [Trypanosoma grayi]